MDYIKKVQQRQADTDAMFEPLKQTIELLKTYNQDMSDEVYAQLQVGKLCINECNCNCM